MREIQDVLLLPKEKPKICQLITNRTYQMRREESKEQEVLLKKEESMELLQSAELLEIGNTKTNNLRQKIIWSLHFLKLQLNN